MTELKSHDLVDIQDYRGEVYLKRDADSLIAEKDAEIRRLRRALYKACSNWAHEAKFDYDDEFSRWDNMEQRCLIKAEEVK